MFPFNDVSTGEVSGLAEDIARLEGTAHALGLSSAHRRRGLCLAVHCILALGLTSDSLRLADCAAHGAELCIYASCLGFRSLFSLEWSEKGLALASARLNTLRNTPEAPPPQQCVDYFPSAAEVVCLDSSRLADLRLDEGAVLLQFFSLAARNCLPGTFLIVFTRIDRLRREDFGVADSVAEMFRSRVAETSLSDYVYVFKVTASRSVSLRRGDV